LGNTGFKLPIISLGCGRISDPAIVRAAMEKGIMHLDTAFVYQNGRSEEMLSGVIKDLPRDSFNIASKAHNRKVDNKTGIYKPGTTAQSFIDKCETSLKRLGLDYVDIFYVHDIVRGESILMEQVLEAFQKLKKEGKTRFIGVSTHRNEPEVIRACIKAKIYDVVLTSYNFRQPHRDEVKKSIAEAAKAGLGIVAMKTQAGAFWDKERKQPINHKAALKWALMDENVHTTIPGMLTFDQINENFSVMEDLSLKDNELIDLRLGDALAPSGLYCQQCEKCIEQCPAHADIPTLMRAYMYAYGYGNPSGARETVDNVDLSKLSCSDCATCKVDCSMGFDVKEKVQDILRIKEVPQEFLV